MLASILIAGQKPGSQVIVCTDGLANMGIGKFKSEKIEPETREFYNSLAELAQTKSVSVSIITIEGTECYLEVISEVVNKTNGTVDVVNILDIKNSLDKAYEHNLIATNAKMSLHFPQEMYYYLNPISLFLKLLVKFFFFINQYSKLRKRRSGWKKSKK